MKGAKILGAGMVFTGLIDILLTLVGVPATSSIMLMMLDALLKSPLGATKISADSLNNTMSSIRIIQCCEFPIAILMISVGAYLMAKSSE